MTLDLDRTRWRKSSRSSGQNGDCVELGHTGAVRDSKNPAGQILRTELSALVAAVKTGRFDS
jgi:hypothetical protein